MKEGKSLPSFVLGELWRWCPLILSRGSCPGFGGLLRCRCGPVLSRSLGAALCSAHPMYPEFLLCGAQPPPRLGPASSHPESPIPRVLSNCLPPVALPAVGTQPSSCGPRPFGGWLWLSPGSLSSQLFHLLSKHPELRLVPASPIIA